MDATAIPRREIGFLVYPGFQILDLTGPLSAFDVAGSLDPRASYRLRVVSRLGGPVASASGLQILTEALDDRPFDTFVVVGGAIDEFLALDPGIVTIVKEQAASARRIASVCTGAFLLAQAGLLDGKVATVHWKSAAHLQRSFPRVKVDGERIYTRDGNVWTSAGISAGIDLALALVEDDVGMEVSRATARMLVVYHRRPGGQSQFSALLDLEPTSERFRAVLTYMREHIGEKLSIEKLAAVACLSTRQFSRSFTAETGETPAKAIERLRAEAARQRIEDGPEPIELIAQSVGFGDPERMRRAFLRLYGHPPQSVRRLARAA